MANIKIISKTVFAVRHYGVKNVINTLKDNTAQGIALSTYDDDTEQTVSFTEIEITRGKYFQLTLAHEFGHMLSLHHVPLTKQVEVEENETIAWSLAKSFIKPQYWDEAYALECLATYDINIPSIEERNVGIKY